MFEICSKTNKNCAFCGKSYYNPIEGKNTDKEIYFCGVASSFDTRILSLPDCWLKMSKSQKSTYTKKKKEEFFTISMRRKNGHNG